MAFVWFFYGFLMVLINVEMAKWLFDGLLLRNKYGNLI